MAIHRRPLCVAARELKVQREAGMAVLGCREALVYHEELIDDRKSQDLTVADADNAKLFAKWKLPEKFSYPDPAAGYQAMLRERGLLPVEQAV